MDLARYDFTNPSRERKIAPVHLAREYTQLEFLRRISTSPLKQILCFKGGTALHLIFNMERYSEDLDFSLTKTHPPKSVLDLLQKTLSGEEITDAVVKRKTVLVEVREPFSPHTFRIKFEVNTDDVAPGELKTLYSEYAPASFNLQIMRTDYLVAQKIRALMQRDKARDLYDLWFILRTKLPINVRLVAKLLDIHTNNVIDLIEQRITRYSSHQIAMDLSPFVKSSQRSWIKSSLRKDVEQLVRSLMVRG